MNEPTTASQPVLGVVWHDEDGASLVKRGSEDAWCANHRGYSRLYAAPQPAPSAVAGECAMAPDNVPRGFDKCPITGRPFFMNIDHDQLGYVATYGGPFDSYTIPALARDGSELRSERYDHEDGRWIEGGEPVLDIFTDDAKSEWVDGLRAIASAKRASHSAPTQDRSLLQNPALDAQLKSSAAKYDQLPYWWKDAGSSQPASQSRVLSDAVSSGQEGDDPGEFGQGHDIGPGGRYWRERAEMWRGWFMTLMARLRPLVPTIEYPEGATDINAFSDAMQIAGKLEALVEAHRNLHQQLSDLLSCVHDEIAANLAFRAKGRALPAEDMPTFCARLIAERDGMRSALQTIAGWGCENTRDARGCFHEGRAPNAEFLAERCCAPCIAALAVLPNPSAPKAGDAEKAK